MFHKGSPEASTPTESGTPPDSKSDGLISTLHSSRPDMEWRILEKWRGEMIRMLTRCLVIFRVSNYVNHKIQNVEKLVPLCKKILDVSSFGMGFGYLNSLPHRV